MENDIKIIWLSANQFGYELLKETLKTAKISAIITLDKRTKTKMYDGIETKKWNEFKIPVYKVKDINKEKKLVSSLDPDFAIMAGWRQIIKKDILNIPKKGFIGFHPSLLPQGRGPAPIINTILLGMKKSGATMFYLGQGTDDGDIIGQFKFKVNQNDYSYDVYNKFIEAGKKLVKKYLPLLIQDKAPRIVQNEKKASYFPKRTLKNNKINLDKDDIMEINRKVRAFSKPYNGAYIKLNNNKVVIWKLRGKSA